MLTIFLLLTSCKPDNTSKPSPEIIGTSPPLFPHPNPYNTHDIVNPYIISIFQDSNRNFWFGPAGQSVARYDGKTFTEFTTKDGLGGSEVWGIYREKYGIIWISARGSTTRYDPSVPISNSKAFTVFTVADGINCCVQIMYQDRSGNMWWGPEQGLYRFDGKRFYQVKQNGPWL